VSTLEQWRFEPDGGDWEDVVRRARRRLPLGRAALAVAAALVVAGPALGLVTTLRSGHARPRLTAELSGRGGVHGTFTAFSPGFWIARHGGRRLPFTPTGHERPLLIGWSVRTDGTVTAVRIRTTTLCDPCQKPGGVLRLEARAAVKLLSDAPVVTVTAGDKKLRGYLRFR
jgi:hypothetical protein